MNNSFHSCHSLISVLLVQGEFTKLEGLRLKPGSVIRSEQKGHRWLVDGKLVVSSMKSDETRHFENKFLPIGHINNEEDRIIPCFSGKGTWSLSQIVLSCPQQLSVLQARSCCACLANVFCIVDLHLYCLCLPFCISRDYINDTSDIQLLWGTLYSLLLTETVE